MLPITEVKFKCDFRDFKKGDTYNFSDKVTIIAGDNGSGKSSLIGLVRSYFEKDSLKGFSRSLANEVATYKGDNTKTMMMIDLANESLKSQHYIEDDYATLHLSCMQHSSGQASMLELSSKLDQLDVDLLIFDEPERGLSLGRQHVVAYLISEWIKTNPTSQVIIVTHSNIIMNAIESLGKLYVMPTFRSMKAKDYQDKVETHGLNVVKFMQLTKDENLV